MPDILHRVGINRSADKVYQALATLDGLSHGWIAGTTGSARVGGVLRFGEEGGGFHLKVLAARPGKLVQWRCIAGPDDWVERGESPAHPYDVKIHVGD
jgi:uncharacterized protein YndB with AHSA1/START domain